MSSVGFSFPPVSNQYHYLIL